MSEESEVEKKGFLYATPLIEVGSVVLSSPGDHFALNQQYFHKTVILIVEHSDSFTRGVILNRPTAFNAGDLTANVLEETGKMPDLAAAMGLDENPDLGMTVRLARNITGEWNVWCGGDCEGLNSRNSGGLSVMCLHTLESLASVSHQIIRGVFQIHLSDAQRLVQEGDAEVDDFLLLAGYCGWSPGQLQGELDRGDTWTMAAADQATVLGQLREAQARLRVRLEAATGPITPADVGDGIAEWQQLYEALGDEYKVGEAGVHTDTMLQRWIGRCLIPRRLQKPSQTGFRAAPTALKSGTVLRGSATAWVLGSPAERQDLGFNGLPGQFLHKSVVLLIKDTAFEEPSLLVLLNGPQVGESGDVPVHFGGPARMGDTAVFALEGCPERFQGFILLRPGLLPELLQTGALAVAGDVDVHDIFKAPQEERWTAAGGQIETLEDAAEAQLGDVQVRKWYSRFLGMDG